METGEGLTVKDSEKPYTGMPCVGFDEETLKRK